MRNNPTPEFERRGDGPVLVLQHGFLSGAAYWEYQITMLSEHFDVIAPNLPGYAGRQGPAASRIEDFGATVTQLLDRQGVESFSILGHSMGGMIAQQIALDHPGRVEQLILFGTGPKGELPGRFESIEASKARVVAEGPGSTIPRTVASWFRRGGSDPHYARGIALANTVSADTMIGAYDAWLHWSAADRLASIEARTLVLWADCDASYEWSQPEALWRGIPDASLGVIPGAAHNAHLERPTLFNQMVLDFLQAGGVR